MQQKSVMTKQFHCGDIHWARGWLSCVVLIGLVNYVTVLTGLATPDPTRSFDGLGQSPSDFTYPPDTNGAVSRRFIMTPLNGEGILFQNKEDGSFAGRVDFGTFWQNAGVFNFYAGYDPVVIFDPYTNRWFFTMAGNNGWTLLIAASQTEDPRSAWYGWEVFNPYATAGVLDHPKMGFNGKWVVVQAEVFGFGSPFTALYVFDKVPLMTGIPPSLGTAGPDTPAQNYKFIGVDADQGGYMNPALTYDASFADEFLLQSSKAPYPQTMTALTYYRIYGVSAASAQLSAGTQVPPLANNSWVSRGLSAPQRNSPDRIADDDDEIHTCIYRNGSLWTAQTVYLPVNPFPTISAVQWWQISPAASPESTKVVQHGLIGGPSIDGNFRSYPTLAVNANENALIGYAFFSPNAYPSGAYSFRLGTDPPNTLQNQEKDCGVGMGPYRAPGANPNFLGYYRWGDYSSAVIDPVDDRSMWTIQMHSGPITTMTPTPVTTTQDSSTITAPIDTFSEDHVGADISGPGIPCGSIIGAFHTSSSVDLYDAATGAPANATASDTVEAIIGDVCDVPNPFRLWATHWISISLDFGRFVAGQGHSLGQDPISATALAASGLNDYGQLGNNGTMNFNHPVSAGGSLTAFGLYKIIDVAAGFHNSLAVDRDGTVFVWGSNEAGQLGTGFTDSSPHSTPAPIPDFNLFKPDNGLHYYVPVSTGFGISPSIVSFKLLACAAVDYLGQVWMWGFNIYGQLGDGTTIPHYTPKKVKDVSGYWFTGVVSIETGDDMTIALKSDGTVWGWGSGCFGALGDGDTSCPGDLHIRTHPQQVLIGVNTPLTKVVQVACGRASDFCLALTQGGTVYGWGANGSYQLGLNDNVDRGYATLIPNLTGVRRVAAGGYHSLALVPSESGRVYAWGQNGYGQCGLGGVTGLPQPYPRPMGGTNNLAFTDIAAGNNFSLMIRGGPQEVWGTGDNIYGQLATGNNSLYTLPTLTQY